MEIFDDADWQMSGGERAALEGVLTQCRPALAVEVGTAEGGSLARLAAHAAEVHSFDFVRPQFADELPANVTFHTGDPHELLPAALVELADSGRNVDFVLLDGDSSPDGARRDLEVLLNSPALTSTVILVHQVTGERVRRGLDAVRFPAWPKVVFVDLDFVPGCMLAEERLRHRLAGGLALVLVDAARLRYHTASVVAERCYSTTQLLADVRDLVIARERGGDQHPAPKMDQSDTRVIDGLRRELAETEHELQRLRSVARHHEELWRSLMDSWSWRITTPIRLAKQRVRGG
ncbi:MAG: class I SAM-dependent methyltransferase [Solirubrobacteraceae bacterium]